MSEGTYEVDNLAEMNFYTTFIQVRILCRVVDELLEFSLAHLQCMVIKHKEECINCVRFSGTIGAYD
jgi:hypothetical protein